MKIARPSVIALFAMAAVLSTAGPVPGSAAEAAEVWRHHRLLGRAGDLNRDGTPDLYMLETDSTHWRIRARSGRTGAALWRARTGSPGDFQGPVELTGRAPKEPVFFAERFFDGGSHATTVTVRRGRDGSVLWRRSFPRLDGAHGSTSAHAVRDYDGDDRPDLLFIQHQSTEQRRTITVRVLKGRSGEELARQDFVFAENGYSPLAAPLGDVSGDGLLDVVATGTDLVSGVPTAEARSMDGTVLWSSPVPEASRLSVLDLTGGVTDVLLYHPGVTALEGSSGRLLWMDAGRLFQGAIGDVDGDGGQDILLSESIGSVGAFEARQGTTGVVLYRRPVLPPSDLPEGSTWRVQCCEIARVDRDGVSDVVVRGLIADDHSSEYPGWQEQRIRVHDGLTGALMWRRSTPPAGEEEHYWLRPFDGDLNGDGGMDISWGIQGARRTDYADSLRFFDGERGVGLWRIAAPEDMPYTRFGPLLGLRLTRDRGQEVVVEVAWRDRRGRAHVGIAAFDDDRGLLWATLPMPGF